MAALQEEELPWAWFVCTLITETTEQAAELLRSSWKDTVEQLAKAKKCPRKSFRAMLTAQLCRNSQLPISHNPIFAALPPPILPQKFHFFVQAIQKLPQKERNVFLFHRFGEFEDDQIAVFAAVPESQVKEYLSEIEQSAMPRIAGMPITEQIRCSTEFRGSNLRLFAQIDFSELFLATLAHDYSEIYHTTDKYSEIARKDTVNMAQQSKKPQAKQGTLQKQGAGVNRRAAQKKKKTILLSAVAAVLVIALIITIVLVAQRNNMPETTRITTYNIDEVTYGNVSTTISGSGSLSPITRATLTLADCIDEAVLDTVEDPENQPGSGSPSLGTLPNVTGVISDVAVCVGDTVAKGDVIAVITFDDGDDDDDNDTTANIIAPYDAVLLEFYLHDGDEVTDTSNVAMFMGTDGYSMTISVDETNISTVKLGQEVDITIDAVTTDDALVGSVTDISYNGSTSGSVTAYGITVTFDYVEGTYPGMSVSAEIVIEDSGDGLLLPVDAVYTSGDTKYVYLAPGGASLGDEYEEGDLDTSKLTKVTVETGMSDGTYMIVESSQLEEGDLIVITKITSTITGSDSDSGGNGGFGGGGFGGGGFGGGSFPGGNLPEGFDPSQFGGSFPGFGG